MPGVMWLPASMSDVNNYYKVVGPSSLTVRPKVHFVQGPQRLWALESQLHGSSIGLSRPGTASTGARVSLGNSPSPTLDDGPIYTVHHDVLRTKRCTP